MSHYLSSVGNCVHSIAKMANTLNLPLLHSLESVLELLEKNKTSKGVQELLDIYNKAKEEKAKFESSNNEKPHPFIVLEGLDGSGKSTTGGRFAKKIQAIKWKTPPESICHIRNLFDEQNELRTAYYTLGNYIAALEVQTLLQTSPVVMDRYWHSTAAYAIAQQVQDEPDKYTLPPAEDAIYKWPENLFKPDIVLLLNVSEDVRKQRQSRRQEVTEQEVLLNNCVEFRTNVLQVYKNMRNPDVIFVNSNYGFGRVLNDMQERCKHLLQLDN